MSMDFERRLPIPMEVKERYPLTMQLEELVARRAKEIADIFTGASDKLLLIIGPCSADNEDSVIDYISRLRTVQDKMGECADILRSHGYEVRFEPGPGDHFHYQRERYEAGLSALEGFLSRG